MATVQNDPRQKTGIVSANTQVKPVAQTGMDMINGTMGAPTAPVGDNMATMPGEGGYSNSPGFNALQGALGFSGGAPAGTKTRGAQSKNSYGHPPASTPGSKNSYGRQPGSTPSSLIDMQENPHNGTQFFGGGNTPPMGPMPPAGGSGGFQSPNPYANPYSGRGYGGSSGGGYSRPVSTYETRIDGVSAVNPRGGSMDKWVNEAYDTAMTRLNPQMAQQKATFDQQMVNQGIPVGSEAYNKALQQMDQNQNDAKQAAMFNAMGFGRDTQQQMFGQDAQRAQLANALLQARMGNELAWDNNALNWNRNDMAWENMGNQWNYAWDRANQSDLAWLDNMNFRERNYNDQQDWMYYNARNAMLGAIPGWNPMQIDVNGAANQAYNSQYGNANLQNTMNQQAWSNMMDVAGIGASAFAMSDERLKEDIEPIGVIDGINIYTWNWNDEAKRLGVENEPRIGVIAQEIPAQFTTVKDGYLAVDYGALFGGI